MLHQFILISNLIFIAYSHPKAQNVIFPNQRPVLRPRAQQKPCNINLKFCETVDNYPRSDIDNELKRNDAEFRALFGNDVLDDLGQRDAAEEFDSLCGSFMSIVYPKTAQDIDGNWKTIVNHDPYPQGIRVEHCVDGRSRTNSKSCKFTNQFPNGYTTECQQKFVYRKLVAFDNSTKKAYKGNFLIPSCCACAVKLDEDFK